MSQNDNSREERVNEVIAAFLQAVERGENPEPEKFLAAHPDLAAELNSFFTNRDCFQQAAGKQEQEHTPVANEATLAFQGRGVPSPKDVIRYFGDYELLEEIARGGMGVVFKARQVTLNRIVAVKMILAGSFAGPEDVERFHTEAEAAAQLDHPGIVPIYEVGQHEGQHYFSMGFVEGQSLGKKVAEGPLPPKEAAEIVKTVAEAVQYAHDKGVIHRDLKPGNILLDKEGKPRVTDFGLAKLTESGSDLTGTGQILGTPSYMPPEQAAAQVSAVGRLSDVYSLGAVLYCLLTGRPPFQAANPLETLLQVQKQDPVPPRQLNPNIPLDLDTIALKCLDKSPVRRYASARVLAEELQRYLDGRPILARPVGRLERFWRWCRREPVVASLSAAVAAALLGGTIISTYYAVLAKNRADEKAALADEKGKLANKNQALFESERDAKEEERLAKERAVEAAQKEEQERIKAERQLRMATAEKLAAHSYVNQAESSELGLALAVESGRATRHNEEGLLASSHQALIEALSHISGVPLVGHQRAITGLAISPDSRWLVTSSYDKTARLWDLTAENPAANPRVLSGHQRGLTSVAISADSRWLVTGGPEKEQVWDLTAENPAANPRVLSWHQAMYSISSAAISADGHWLVTGSSDRTARLWDLTAENPAANPHVLSGHQKSISSVAISADSRWLVAGGTDNMARVWDLAAEHPAANPRVLSGHQDKISSMAISADSRWLVTGSGDTARVWDLAAEDPAANPRVLSGHQGGITSVAISADSRWLVTGSRDKTARVWDLTAENPAASPRILSGIGAAARISADGRWLVTARIDNALVWDLTTENPSANLRVLSGHQKRINIVAISPDSRWLVTGSDDKTARVWDLTAENPAANPRVLSGHQDAVWCMAISADNRWLVTGSVDNTARVWGLAAVNPTANPRVLSEHQAAITRVAISANSRWLVTGSPNKALMWDLAAENPAASPRILTGGAVAISPDGRCLVTGRSDKALVWDLTAENPVANPRVLSGVLSGHQQQITSVAISADSHWLVSGSMDRTARVWDLTAENPAANPRVLSGHQSVIASVAISPDSRWLVTGSETARLWDLAIENPAASPRLLSGHQNAVWTMAISPDGRWLVTGSRDKTARVWDLTAENPAANSRVLSGHQGEISSVAISADSRWLVTGSVDNTARVWDLTAENPAANPSVLRGHRGRIKSLAISTDSRWLVTGSDTARLWDLAAENPAGSSRVLSGHQDVINDVTISPDGRWLVTGSRDKTARVWQWQWDDLIGIARQVGRNLTSDEWARYLPGEPYRKTFPGLPIPASQTEAHARDDAMSATAVGTVTGRAETEGSAGPPINADIARTPGLSEAERFFELADKDKNGEVSEEEFNRCILVRVKFRNAGIIPTFPLRRDDFVKLYSQVGSN
jgi:WD40 repeat protein/serine/threonine protein kinase